MQDLKITHGLTGNYYITASTPNQIVPMLNKINKSLNSIYYNQKHQTFAARIKLKSHKKLLKLYFSHIIDQNNLGGGAINDTSLFNAISCTSNF